MERHSPPDKGSSEIELQAPIEQAIEYLLSAKFHNEGTKATYKRYLLRYCDLIGVTNLAEILDISYQDIIDRCIVFVGENHNPNTRRVMLAALGVLFDHLSKNHK